VIGAHKAIGVHRLANALRATEHSVALATAPAHTGRNENNNYKAGRAQRPVLFSCRLSNAIGELAAIKATSGAPRGAHILLDNLEGHAPSWPCAQCWRTRPQRVPPEDIGAVER